MTPPTLAKDSRFGQYLTEAGELPPDVLLGWIVFFTVTDEPIARQQLVDWFTELNLDASMLPPEIKAIDAYKKATSEAKESYPMSDGRQAFVLCRDVNTTGDYIRRQITREIKDVKRKSLDYSAAITATFYRGVGSKAKLDLRLHSDVLEHEEHDHMEMIQKAIEVRFERYYRMLDGNKLRAVVRNYLKQPLNGIEIRGGVYFVHASRNEELTRLAELVNRFGGGCMMHAVPIVNLERERAFIAKAFETEASNNLGDIAKEVKEALANNVTPAVYTRLKKRYDEVLARAEEHIVTLEVSQDMTAAAAEVAHDLLARLQEKMLDD